MFAKRLSPLVLLAILLAPSAAYSTQVNPVRHASAVPTIKTYSFEGLITRGPDGGITGTGPMTFTITSSGTFTGTAFLPYNTTPVASLHLDLDGETSGTVLRFDLDYGKQGYAFLVGQIDPTAPISGTYSGTFDGPSSGDSGAWYLRPR